MTDHSDLREKAAAATPGPWETYLETSVVLSEGSPAADGVVSLNMLPYVFSADLFGPLSRHDAAYIAAADPTTVIGLLDENERLRGALLDILCNAEYGRMDADGKAADYLGLVYDEHADHYINPRKDVGAE